jgi:hypothetical protein
MVPQVNHNFSNGQSQPIITASSGTLDMALITRIKDLSSEMEARIRTQSQFLFCLAYNEE